MPPRRRPRSSTDYRGVRERSSGHFAAEITVDGFRDWLDTFEKEEAARAFDLAVWPHGLPRSMLNFDDVDNLQQAEFVANLQETRIRTRRDEREQRRARRHLAARESDDALMKRFAETHPEHVRAEEAFYAAKAAEETEKKKTGADDAGPSTAAEKEYSSGYSDFTGSSDEDEW